MLTINFQALYNNTTITHMELVRKIQTILRSLDEIRKSFPPDLVLDFSQSALHVARTSASLHLMMFQVCIAVS